MAVGKKAKFQIGDGASPEVFTDVANVTVNNPSGPTWDTEETTPHDGGNLYKKFLPTLADAGNVQITLSPYDASDTDHVELKNRSNDDGDGNGLHNYRIFIDEVNEQMTFAAFITSAPWDLGRGGLIKKNVNFKISGKPTIEATP